MSGPLVFRVAVAPSPTFRSEALTPGAAVFTGNFRSTFSGRRAAAATLALLVPTRRPTRLPAGDGGAAAALALVFLRDAVALRVTFGVRVPELSRALRTTRTLRSAALLKASG